MRRKYSRRQVLGKFAAAGRVAGKAYTYGKRKAKNWLNTRAKPKQGGSKTISGFKRKGRIGGYQDNNSHVSKSRCLVRYPKMKGYAIKNANVDLTRKRSVHAGISRIGQQTFFNIQSEAGTGDCEGVYQQMIDTNVANRNTLLTSLEVNSYKLWLDYKTSTTTLTNQGPGTVELIIYDCIAKVDNCLNCNTAWSEGIKEDGGLDSSQELILNPGSYPTDSKKFKSMWTVKKISKVRLGTGSNHIHTFTHVYNGLWNLARAREINKQYGATNTNMKGVSHQTWIVQRGMPVDNENRVQAFQPRTPDLQTGISINMGKVIAITNTTYKTRLLSSKARHVSYPGFLPDSMDHAYGQNPDGSGTYDTVVNEAAVKIINGPLSLLAAMG